MRIGGARVARLVALGTLAGLVAAPWPQPPAAAACTPPTITIEGAPDGVAALRRGQEVTVTGQGFVEGCGTSGGGPLPGCTRQEPLAEPIPASGVTLELVGGRISRRATALGTADADGADDRLGRISWTVRVPDGQSTGPGALRVDGPGDLTLGLGVEILPEE